MHPYRQAPNFKHPTMRAAMALAEMRRRGRDRVGAAGDLTATAGEINDFDAAVRHLDDDISAQATGAMVDQFSDWVEFRTRWETWLNDNAGGTFSPSTLFNSVAAPFHDFQSEYDDKLRIWKKLITTSAPLSSAASTPLVNVPVNVDLSSTNSLTTSVNSFLTTAEWTLGLGVAAIVLATLAK